MDENSKIEQIKKMYPEGTKIKLNYMKDNYNPVPNGTLGIVDHVDDAGQIHVKWENGSSLALLYDEDDFEIINEKTNEKAFERKIKYIDNFDKSAEKESTIAELKKEIDDVNKKLDKHIDSGAKKDMKDLRHDILDFSDRITEGSKPSKDAFTHTFDIAVDYHNLIEEYNLTNGVIDIEMENIKKKYAELYLNKKDN